MTRCLLSVFCTKTCFNFKAFSLCSPCDHQLICIRVYDNMYLLHEALSVHQVCVCGRGWQYIGVPPMIDCQWTVSPAAAAAQPVNTHSSRDNAWHTYVDSRAATSVPLKSHSPVLRGEPTTHSTPGTDLVFRKGYFNCVLQSSLTGSPWTGPSAHCRNCRVLVRIMILPIFTEKITRYTQMRNVNEVNTCFVMQILLSCRTNCGSDSNWIRQSTVSCTGGLKTFTFTLSPRSVPGTWLLPASRYIDSLCIQLHALWTLVFIELCFTWSWNCRQTYWYHALYDACYLWNLRTISVCPFSVAYCRHDALICGSDVCVCVCVVLCERCDSSNRLCHVVYRGSATWWTSLLHSFFYVFLCWF